MPESVFHVVHLGRQAGTMSDPGTEVGGDKVLYPVSEAVIIELDRATEYPAQDWGRNAAARAGTGYHGVRGASFSLASQLRFEDFMYLAESHYAGDVTPASLGGGVYQWVYPLESGIPTLVPLTVESGSESAIDQWAAVGAFCDELTLSFEDLDSPGAHPWTIESTWLALNRVARTLTPDPVLPTALEVAQGQNSLIKLGPVATAFGSLTELPASLISFSLATSRHMELRAYGGDTDGASAVGFSEKTSGEVTMKLKIWADSKTRVYDEWENGSPFADDVRVRIDVPGSGSKQLYIDFALGMTAIPVGTRGGERVYEVTGQILDEDDLDAPAQITIENGISALAAVGS
jgi:hypothetical protein